MVRAVKLAAAGGLAPSTVANYISGWRSWQRLLALLGLLKWRWNPPDLLLAIFVAWASLRVKPESVRTYLCGIRNAHLATGRPDPTTPGVLTRRALKEIQVRNGTAVLVRLSITTPLLKVLLLAIGTGSHNCRCLRAAVSLGVFLLLRIGELTRAGPFGLKRRDWRAKGGLASLCLRKSKADQAGKGVTLALFESGGPVCALSEVKRYLALSRVHKSEDQPLFLLEDGRQLSSHFLMRACEVFFCKLGYNKGDFSGISLRKGGALSMAMAHVPDRVIRGVGRWKGWCYDRYICLTAGAIRRAQRAIGRLAAEACAIESVPAKDLWALLE